MAAPQAEAIRFNKGEDLTSIGQLAERLLRTFQASDLARTKSRILGVEEEVRGTVAEGVPEFLARIDLILETDDAVEVYDFKTARAAWSSDEASGPINQLAALQRPGPTARGRQAATLGLRRPHQDEDAGLLRASGRGRSTSD